MSKPTTANFTFILTVLAKAISAHTMIQVNGQPAVGVEFLGIEIFPYDSDKLRIMVDNNENFEVNDERSPCPLFRY